MSNEELVIQIQAGATERMGELWEQVEKLVKWKSNRVVTALENSGVGCKGVEFDDLYQSGYLAMVNAVGTYKPENGVFVTWFMYYLKKAFAEASGYRTGKGQREPLNNSLSLDKTFDDESDGATFGSLIPDPEAAATMEAVDEEIWREQLHEALESALGDIPDEQSEILRHRYYDGQTLAEAGRDLGISAEDARKLENKGLRALRQPRTAKKIRPFYDFNYFYGSSLGAFRDSGMSVQERYLIRMERQSEKKKPEA